MLIHVFASLPAFAQDIKRDKVHLCINSLYVIRADHKTPVLSKSNDIYVRLHFLSDILGMELRSVGPNILISFDQKSLMVTDLVNDYEININDVLDWFEIKTTWDSKLKLLNVHDPRLILDSALRMTTQTIKFDPRIELVSFSKHMVNEKEKYEFNLVNRSGKSMVTGDLSIFSLFVFEDGFMKNVSRYNYKLPKVVGNLKPFTYEQEQNESGKDEKYVLFYAFLR